MSSLAVIVLNGEHREPKDWLYRAALLNHRPAKRQLADYSAMFGGLTDWLGMMNPFLDSAPKW